ncbi:MAG: DNA polymerase I [Ruminococcaceae bacterium]|nr:DNA polymerase I [Oscillospiraceae bacterium]
MKLLVIDGNSILNRAFYGVRLLTTKDGRYTNGVFGFMNIFLHLLDEYKPDGVAIAFDLKAPTFRHKMYGEYKGTRKPAPSELIEQFPVLKELLGYLGYKVVEKEGFEADDILGTLSAACGEGDFCYIATGDRDSLQLVKSNVNVVLATTKMGQSATVLYDEAKINEVYGVTPRQLIDIKAIQGDTSDNIPGVAGIGEKGAGELIRKFGSLEYIYENLENIDIKAGVRAKLEASQDNAFLSKKLGEICLEAPVSTVLSDYIPAEPDAKKATNLLMSLEMFKLLNKLHFEADVEEVADSVDSLKLFEIEDKDDFLNKLRENKKAYFKAGYNNNGIEYLLFKTPEGVALVSNSDFSFISFVNAFLSDEKIEKNTDNIKELYSYCMVSGIEPAGIAFDTELAAYLLNPNSSDYSIKSLAGAYGVPSVKIEATGCLDEFFKEKKAAVESAAVLESLCAKLLASVKENSQEKLLSEIEMPLARVLASMELEGFSVDRAGIEGYNEKISARLEECLAKIYDMCSCEFNVNSPKQLGDVLFSEDKLNLPHGKKTKTGYSTNAEVLEALRDKHPVINVILEYRALSKLKSTYCEGLLKVIDIDGRIHSTLNQTETRTGRISSAEPNLQNIPVRTELGRELRKFFNARDGFVLVDADYSQIELRVLAAMSGDSNMIKAFLSGDDIHSITASQIMNIPLEQVTSADRRKAKAVNFGIVYGIGAFSLSNDIGVSVVEADRYIKSYLANYSGVAAFMENAKSSAKEKGYAETVFGRRRYLPELQEKNAIRRGFGERVAMNMPIQGTAADIIKIAMIKVFDRLKEECPEAKLILQVHDELIIEAPEKEAERVAELLKNTMESACELEVPLTVEVAHGKTWYETK